MKAKSINANATPVMSKKFNPFAHRECITDCILPKTSLLVDVKTPLTELIPDRTKPLVALTAEVMNAPNQAFELPPLIE